jgi:hypothetical protein
MVIALRALPRFAMIVVCAAAMWPMLMPGGFPPVVAGFSKDDEDED